jgi:hypothetical protein
LDHNGEIYNFLLYKENNFGVISFSSMSYEKIYSFLSIDSFVSDHDVVVRIYIEIYERE